MLVNVRYMSFYEGSEALVFVRSLNHSWTSPLLLRGNPTTGHLGNISRDILLAIHEQ